jgi:zinc protease
MRKTRLALALFLAAAAQTTAQAAASPKLKRANAVAPFKAFPFPTELHTLPNGLRVVFVPYDSPGLAGYYTLMRVGSRNEPEKGRSGYAHFFEHMMFRGTKKHSGEEYNATMSRLGLNVNAFTSEDETVYHLFGPSKALPTIIELESDRFENLDYSEPQFKTEAGAILGEYAKSASDPEQKLEEVLSETAYTQHTYRHTVIGYLDDVKHMPSGFAYSREFFRRYYTPDNATIFVVGDFDKTRTLSLIEKAYGGWKGKLDPAPIAEEPPQNGARRAHVEWRTPTLSRLWMVWHAPSGGDLKAAAVQTVLSGYLFGPTSPLHQDLVLGRQLVDSIEDSYENHRDAFTFGVLARVKEDRDLATVEEAVLRQVAELAGGKVDLARLEAVRSHLKYATVLSQDSAPRVASRLAVSTAITGDLDYLNQLYAQIEAVKPSDLVAFAKQYLVEPNRTTVTLTGPGGAK